jgi:hypothetical protein
VGYISDGKPIEYEHRPPKKPCKGAIIDFEYNTNIIDCALTGLFKLYHIHRASPVLIYPALSGL